MAQQMLRFGVAMLHDVFGLYRGLGLYVNGVALMQQMLKFGIAMLCDVL